MPHNVGLDLWSLFLRSCYECGCLNTKPRRYKSTMNSLAQFTLLTVLSRGRFQGYENHIWNGSRASLPIVSPTKSSNRPVSQHSSEERSEGRKQSDNGTSRHGRSNSAGSGSSHSHEDDAGSYLKGELYSAVLLAQSFVILGEIGLVGCSAVQETDDDGFESWNRLLEFCLLPLLIFFSLSISTLLMHLVGCLSITFHLSVQAAGSLFATFCGVIVLAASVGLAGDKEPSSAFNGFVAVLCGFGALWTLFIIGFLQAATLSMSSGSHFIRIPGLRRRSRDPPCRGSLSRRPLLCSGQ
ncbi:hypothetical protein HYQ44_005491 [Verticillium longisporum]|nr:hypothetical protein HYQ44_005491 [Verticillium longisporum]